MVKKVYYKPTRSSPRYFKPCDVARIAWNCFDDGMVSDPNVLLACVAKRLGFTHIVLHPDYEDDYKKYLAKEDELDGKTKEQILEEKRLEKAAEELPDLSSIENAENELRFIERLLKLIRNGGA